MICLVGAFVVLFVGGVEGEENELGDDGDNDDIGDGMDDATFIRLCGEFMLIRVGDAVVTDGVPGDCVLLVKGAVGGGVLGVLSHKTLAKQVRFRGAQISFPRGSGHGVAS